MAIPVLLQLFFNSSFVALILFYFSSNPFLQEFTKLLILRGRAVPIQPHHDLSSKSNLCYDRLHGAKKSLLIDLESNVSPQGYINYIYIFYCALGEHPLLGYVLLILWLIVLFYLLADTSANYFCTNLEGLSVLLKLPPTIAGVTLLSFGNGAPDAFSSIVSFMCSGSGVLGLNSVIGGAFFVSCVVVGIISICVGNSCSTTINWSCFIRDLVFFLFVLLVLLVILVVGKINFWVDTAFTSLYLIYVFLVAVEHLFGNNDSSADTTTDQEAPLLEIRSSSESDATKSNSFSFHNVVQCLELPLSLPRRLTIPDISEESWSRPRAVAQVTLAPVFSATLLNSKRKNAGSKESLIVYIIGPVTGLVLGVLAFVKTKDRPPSRFQLPWLAGGFLMSVIWTYLIAQELVSLLVSLGTVLEISPSILGITVLAWGNSVTDLIACMAVAVRGRAGGIQMAVTGCYGGPIFDVSVGLGLSFVFSSWSAYPSAVNISRDLALFQTMGFMVGGLLWALVMLPRRGMRFDRVLGIGLLSIYLCSLSLRIVQYLRSLQQRGTCESCL
ncbi:cation/calcium exchanger 1-like [Zingiber officinale]|uniref:cation/calcium exchanger 1-like n=1 Tax=Zingiber officinale TaxID=94328 RepID=UPI001C4BCD9D|nr:cation/calcium exchanger 1-like [Zingiber officinale]XP_042424299.1 cation/calcium exchanger 1-like [Zingiber officinale]XP_042424300.1 cation/calcium exchanger 1-like [Zingiber officinale]XP_042424301.1 cation/calcium exchanger 1-like [Zingiber officinale]XP_042424302.1 cation/calcium exchanger 1-like [Zingiber officinale]XP_042424303.1 cation/calcium exchanger 1-like [Zingiber officinale]